MSLCSIYFGCAPEHQELYSKDDDLTYHECLDCGIIWRDEESYDLELPYNQQYFESKNYEVNREHKIEKSGWLLDIAIDNNPKLHSLLEVGCSLGNTLEAASRKGLDHLGIDVSSFAVRYCQDRGLNASTETLQELVGKEEIFDLIFMQHVLEHFKDPFTILKQCNELLAPGGMVLILIPNSNYHSAKRQRNGHRFYSKKGVGIEHFVYFNYHNLSRVLASCGFKTVQSNYPFWVNDSSLKFFLNRIGRRMLSTFNWDQELVILAEKVTSGMTTDTNLVS